MRAKLVQHNSHCDGKKCPGWGLWGQLCFPSGHQHTSLTLYLSIYLPSTGPQQLVSSLMKSVSAAYDFFMSLLFCVRMRACFVGEGLCVHECVLVCSPVCASAS